MVGKGIVGIGGFVGLLIYVAVLVGGMVIGGLAEVGDTKSLMPETAGTGASGFEAELCRDCC